MHQPPLDLPGHSTGMAYADLATSMFPLKNAIVLIFIGVYRYSFICIYAMCIYIYRY